MATENCKEVEVVGDQEAPLHGDILEAILSHVPLIDLVAASHVSKSWKSAVFSSLHQSTATTNNKLNQWLIVHKQRVRSPYHTTTHAYDPRSHVWIEITPPPSIGHVSILHSSHSTLLYSLSPSSLSFSSDPLHLTWHHAAPPTTWRSDPVVAAVGRHVIIAGGGCDFEDNPLAVEIYDVESRTWDRTCGSVPANLKDSSSSTWLSIATNNTKLFITEKQSGATHAFEPDTKTWSGPFDLRPDPRICYSVIAFSNDRLILIGLIGDVDGLKGVKMWGVNCDTFECEGPIGEMPLELVAKLKRENSSVCVGGSVVYVYDPEGAEEVIWCELGAGGCRWGSVRCAVAIERNRMERLVFTCSTVGIEDVEKAMRWGNRRFRPLRW